MEEIVAVCPCPWCRKTPVFQMYMIKEETWTPNLKCINEKCLVQPISKYIPIRKKQKYSSVIIGVKIKNMIKQWNQENPYPAYEGLVFDFDKVAEEERKRRGVI
jgi:hypothetical protein